MHASLHQPAACMPMLHGDIRWEHPRGLSSSRGQRPTCDRLLDLLWLTEVRPCCTTGSSGGSSGCLDICSKEGAQP